MIENGTFAWGHGEEDGKPILKGVNMHVSEGELVAVVGSVGAGKSSLCSAILGEMEKQSGRVNIKVNDLFSRAFVSVFLAQVKPVLCMKHH